MSSAELKKSIGRIVIDINSDILDLLSERRKASNGEKLTKKGEDLKERVLEKKKALERVLEQIQSNPSFVKEEKFVISVTNPESILFSAAYQW